MEEDGKLYSSSKQKQQKDGCYEIGICTLGDEEEDAEKERRGRNNNTERGDR